MSVRATEVKQIIEERMDAIGRETRRTLDEFIAAEGSGIRAAIKQLQGENAAYLERIEELESRAKSPGKTAGGQSREQVEHKALFEAWLRRPGDATAKMRLEEFQVALSRKDVTIGTDSAGGFAVPEQIAREIERLEKKFSPTRSLVKVRPVGTSDYKELVNIRGGTSNWVGETGTRTATSTPSLRERKPTHGELYAYPQASQWSLDDIFFNVGDWLAEEVAQEFALAEGEAVIRGNGTDKPTGLLNTAPVSTVDFASPLRSAEALQFVESDSGASPADGTIVPDALLSLVFELNSIYRSGASFVMNSKTMGEVRKLKQDGKYIWEPGLGGQPSTLLGFPLFAWEQLDDTGVGKFPVLFGNFSRGYVLVDRGSLRITRDEVTNPGFVRFYVRRRVGGIILNNDAVKVLKTV